MSPESPKPILRGDIFWIEPDESRGSIPGRPHPHVVVQDNVFNRSRLTSVIVCALSTNAKLFNEPGNVLVKVGEGNLTKESVVVVSQLSSVHKNRLGQYIGILSAERVDQVLAGLRFQQSSFLHQARARDA
ncbi:MAG: type II toxin-antitoxin system PemK/MazF family toxin [Chitinophagaceae bacterium]|nr:type II toxin-antitoxin system PemK/MazF family toxin [Rubrivivax sp.]